MPRTKKEAAVAEENTVAEGAEALAEPAADAPADAPADAAEPPVQTVRMVRHEDLPGPHTADVHPDEVENMQAGGWAVAPEGAGDFNPNADVQAPE